MSDRIELNGYSFERDMGLEAKREQTAIEYLTKQLNMDEPATVMNVYQQIIKQKLFHTQVGYDFLKGLQNYLITNPEIDNNSIATIEIDSPEEMIRAINISRTKRGERIKPRTNEAAKVTKEASQYRGRAKALTVVVIILIAVVAAMFVITLTSNVPTILNYRETIINQYSEWETQLELREQEVTLREQALGIEQGQSTPAEALPEEDQPSSENTIETDMTEPEVLPVE